MTEAQSVGQAVEQRRAGNPVEEKLHAFESWYEAFTPTHMPASQLVALAIAQFRKSRNEQAGGVSLYQAASGNPASFYAAVAECARLGLVPGVTYHFVGFRDKNATGGVAVTGMTDWKGEVELIHRAGNVEAVVCEVIRGKDIFQWDPSQMRVPVHSIPGNEFDQAGLGDTEDRGPLTGVYCYVRYYGGGTSHPTVMSAAEVRKHFAKAKTTKFWGEWEGRYPKENPGSWTPEMFKKTAIHRHADSVPTSPEYLTATINATAAAAAAMPSEVAAGYAEQARIEGHAYELPPGYDDNGNGNGGPNPKTVTGRVEQRRDAKPPTKAQSVNRLSVLFHEAGLDGPQWSSARLVLAGVFGAGPDSAPLQITNANQLTAQQAALAVTLMEDAMNRVKANDQDPRSMHQVMLDLAAEAGWQDNTGEPSADPESDRDQ